MAQSRSGFLAGPYLDSFFLIGAPLVGTLVLLLLLLEPRFFFPIPGEHLFAERLITTVTLIVTYSHLVIVFFRSHGNRAIFRTYPFRFTVVPLALFALLAWSPMLLAAALILGVWWDVYHSSLQTFGIGRLYDRARGNDLEVGRKLDWWLNLLLYAGPVLGGATLVGHIDHQAGTSAFPPLEKWLFDAVPHRYVLTYLLLAVGIPFCAYYLWAYRRLARLGYRVSMQKVALLVVLALVSILNWGFNSFGNAFFIMNFFHALQYFFIVWFVEGTRMTNIFHLGGTTYGRAVALFLFVFIAASYGVWAQLREPLFLPGQAKTALLIVVSLMHFWYDGFIWSVRKGQV